MWSGYVPPERMNKVHLHFWDAMLGYQLAAKQLQTEIFLQHVLLMINVVPNAPGLTVPLKFEHLKAFIARGSSTYPPPHSDAALLEHDYAAKPDDWPTKRGYVEFLDEKCLGLEVRKAVTENEPKTTIKVDTTDAKVTARCDSFLALIDLILGYLDDPGIAWELEAATPPVDAAVAFRTSVSPAASVISADGGGDDGEEDDAFLSCTSGDEESDSEQQPSQQRAQRRAAEIAVPVGRTQSQNIVDMLADAAGTTDGALGQHIIKMPQGTRADPRGNVGAASPLFFDEDYFATPAVNGRPRGGTGSYPALDSEPLSDPLLAMAEAMKQPDCDGEDGGGTEESPFQLYPSMSLLGGSGGRSNTAGSTAGAAAAASGSGTHSDPETADGVVKMRRSFKVKNAYFSRKPAHDATELEPFFPPSAFKITIEGTSWSLCLQPGFHFAESYAADGGGDDAGDANAGSARPGSSAGAGGGNSSSRRSNNGNSNEALVVKLDGLRVVFDEFSSLSDYVSRVVILAHQVEIFDRLNDSQINKFLTDYKTEKSPRESTADMVRVDVVTVRTPQIENMPMAHPEELILRFSLLPLRLNIDQDALNFLVKFMCYSPNERANADADADADADAGMDAAAAGEGAPGAAPAAAKGPYFKLCVICPISAQVDTISKHLKLKELLQGKYDELFGLMSLDKANLALPNVVVKSVSGTTRLAQDIALQWAEHVRRTQIPGIVTGVPLVRPLANLAHATTQIVSEPLSQFPWVFHGLYDGISSTAQSGAVEACNVATTLTFALQASLELAHGVVSKDEAAVLRKDARSRFAHQPVDAHDGFLNARDALFGAVHEAYNEIVQRPQRQSTKGGPRGIGGTHSASSSPSSALSSVGQGSVLIRMIGAAPGAGLRPLIGICEAMSLSLQGIRNGVSPDSRRDLNDKYRTG